MIVLDTNVVSELMRADPDPAVVSWIDGQHASALYITAVTAAELLFGVERLPVGRRRKRIGLAIADVLETEFAGRVLPFTAVSALEYGRIVAKREHLGHPMGMADGMIAATALSVHASVFATRNTRDFDEVDLTLINPWTASYS